MPKVLRISSGLFPLIILATFAQLKSVRKSQRLRQIQQWLHNQKVGSYDQVEKLLRRDVHEIGVPFRYHVAHVAALQGTFDFRQRLVEMVRAYDDNHQNAKLTEIDDSLQRNLLDILQRNRVALDGPALLHPLEVLRHVQNGKVHGMLLSLHAYQHNLVSVLHLDSVFLTPGGARGYHLDISTPS